MGVLLTVLAATLTLTPIGLFVQGCIQIDRDRIRTSKPLFLNSAGAFAPAEPRLALRHDRIRLLHLTLMECYHDTPNIVALHD